MLERFRAPVGSGLSILWKGCFRTGLYKDGGTCVRLRASGAGLSDEVGGLPARFQQVGAPTWKVQRNNS